MSKMLRPTNGIWIAGVCAAVANFFGIDVGWIRLITIQQLNPISLINRLYICDPNDIGATIAVKDLYKLVYFAMFVS